ncbi:DUF2798 domain-containing protein [Pedobacter frigidisoli]|uniref:DUF2798 domain-containing protein n=1 Tax=Pedobacter frigidisoli TaxID=2530455 RepID=A0A4V2ML48_9SPHI|nr:DUF2798 domain-containing protein [Pedobacter frigidisoli]TCD00667.1 DUF2798 domain-containing protein [Pedobacter frigidisoli]
MKKKITFAFIMAIFTTGIVTFAAISVNLGFTPSFLKIWLKSWGISYIVAIPAILIISPRVQLFVDYLFKDSDKNLIK